MCISRTDMKEAAINYLPQIFSFHIHIHHSKCEIASSTSLDMKYSEMNAKESKAVMRMLHTHLLSYSFVLNACIKLVNKLCHVQPVRPRTFYGENVHKFTILMIFH